MSSAPPPFPIEVTQDDRTMATLAHALSLLGFIAPLVVFFIKRQSRFVSFHALQSLLWQLAYLVVVFVVMVSAMATFFFAFLTQYHKGGSPPVGMFALIPLWWLLLFAGNVTNIVLAIVYAIKAGHGEWTNYPIFGRLARRILKLGPA